MKNYLALAIGVLMIAGALMLAMGTTNQDDATRPEIARQLATRLHETPTDTPPPTVIPTLTNTPLPTSTPVATEIPVLGWNKLETRNVEMWLPPNYQLLDIADNIEIEMFFSRADLVGILKFHAYDTTLGLNSFRSLRVFQVKTRLRPDQVPYGIDISTETFQPPVPVSLGRYTAFRAVADKVSQARSHYTDLLYWIPRGEYYYLVIASTRAEYSAEDIATFDQAIRTMTILSDQ